MRTWTLALPLLLLSPTAHATDYIKEIMTNAILPCWITVIQDAGLDEEMGSLETALKLMTALYGSETEARAQALVKYVDGKPLEDRMALYEVARNLCIQNLSSN